jgi:2-phospho-L-lactate guanylyltransferase
MYHALIPVKALSEVKSRLAPYLTLYQRDELVLTMLQHVIQVMHDCNEITRVSVVSPDARVLSYAQMLGATALPEELQGHNPALHAAAIREKAIGTTALLTISADLPLLQREDIEHMLEASQQFDVVLAPSQEGTGTNAVLMRPPLALPYVFGPHSLQRYQQEAERHELFTTLVKRSGLSLDVDTIKDLELFRRYEEEEKTAAHIVDAAYLL